MISGIVNLVWLIIVEVFYSFKTHVIEIEAKDTAIRERAYRIDEEKLQVHKEHSLRRIKLVRYFTRPGNINNFAPYPERWQAWRRWR